MAYSVMIPSQVMAKDIDSLVRTIKCPDILENGNVVILTGVSATSGEDEVWLASTPTALPVAATPNELWMVGEPEIVLTDSKYKGLDPDPRNFRSAANAIITAFKLKKKDIITLTADAFTGARTTETYADMAVSAHDFVWSATQTGATVLKLVKATTIAINSGSPGTSVTAYRMEVVAE